MFLHSMPFLNDIYDPVAINSLHNTTGDGSFGTAATEAMLTWFQSIVSLAQAKIHALIETAHNFVLEIPDRILTFIHSIPSLVWALLESFSQGAVNVLTQMMVQITSQIIGTGIIGVFLYNYRHKLKEIIADLVNTAGSMVPDEWLDEEAIIDIIEEAAGVDTPSGSEDEREEYVSTKRKKVREDTPLLEGTSSKKQTRVAKRVVVKRKKTPSTGKEKVPGSTKDGQKASVSPV